jgi:hypothetical protein
MVLDFFHRLQTLSQRARDLISSNSSTLTARTVGSLVSYTRQPRLPREKRELTGSMVSSLSDNLEDPSFKATFLGFGEAGLVGGRVP